MILTLSISIFEAAIGNQVSARWYKNQLPSKKITYSDENAFYFNGVTDFRHGADGSNLRIQKNYTDLANCGIAGHSPGRNHNHEFFCAYRGRNPLGNPTSNNAKWLNYTSAVAVGNTRTITASVNQVIPGINIRLQAGAATGGSGEQEVHRRAWLH